MKTLNIIKSIFILSFSFSILTGINAQSDWLMINGNPQRTNYVPGEKILLPPLEKEADISQWAEYLLKKDNIIYLANGGSPNTVTAYDIANQNELWKFEIEGSAGSISYCPAISGNLIFIGGQNGKGLYALDRNTGEQKWFKPFGSQFSKSPILDNKGHIFICNSSNQFLCLNENTGETIWSINAYGYITPTYYNDMIFISTNDELIALNSKTGEKLWKRIHSNGSRGHILIDESGAFICVNNTIACYNPETGNEKWYYQLPDTIYCPSYSGGTACLTDSILCVSLVNQGQTNGRLLAINKFTGAKQWEYISDYPYLQSAVGANGYIYANKNFSNWIGVFNQMTGELVFQDSSQKYWGIIIVDNRLFVLSQTGITVFKSKSSSTYNNDENELLSAISPNPVLGKITIGYKTMNKGKTKIDLFDFKGNNIKCFFDGIDFPGFHKRSFNIANISTGIYVLIIKRNNHIESKKIVVVQ